MHTIGRRDIIKFAAVSVSAVVGVSACSAPSQTDETGPITLRFTWWGGDARQQITKKVIAAFEAENPTITVNGEFGDFANYFDKLSTQVAANDAPDIIQMDEKFIREYGDRGALLDLNKLKGLNTTDIDQNALKSGEVNGKMYGLVVGLASYAIAANPSVLAKAGVPLPDDKTWSWDDYKKIGQQVAKGGPDLTGVSLGYGDDTGVYIWARQHGDRLYDDEANVVIKQETMASYWQYFLDLSKSGAGAKPSVVVERGGAAVDQTPIATNVQAFAPIFSTQLPAFSKAAGHDLKLLRLPGESQTKTKGAYYKSSMFWSVSSRTKHQAAAEKFLNFLENSQVAGNELLAERGIPANTKIRAAITDKLTETNKAAVEFTNQIAPEVAPAPPVTPAGGSAVGAILGRFTSDVLFERTTPEKAAADFIEELKSVIKK